MTDKVEKKPDVKTEEVSNENEPKLEESKTSDPKAEEKNKEIIEANKDGETEKGEKNPKKEETPIETTEESKQDEKVEDPKIAADPTEELKKATEPTEESKTVDSAEFAEGTTVAAKEPVKSADPIEESAKPDPVEEPAKPDPVEESAKPDPVEESAKPDPVEEPVKTADPGEEPAKKADPAEEPTKPAAEPAKAIEPKESKLDDDSKPAKQSEDEGKTIEAADDKQEAKEEPIEEAAEASKPIAVLIGPQELRVRGNQRLFLHETAHILKATYGTLSNPTEFDVTQILKDEQAKTENISLKNVDEFFNKGLTDALCTVSFQTISSPRQENAALSIQKVFRGSKVRHNHRVGQPVILFQTYTVHPVISQILLGHTRFSEEQSSL